VTLLVSILLYVVSEFASVQSVVPLLNGQLQSGQFLVHVYNPSVLQMAIDAAFSLVSQAPAGGYIRLSPVSDAASIGFVLTFLSLLPIALFDGGQMASTILRPGAARTASYVSGLVLLVIDFPTYWIIGLLVIVIGWRQAEVPLMDGVSRISESRRTIFLAMIVLAFLCVPVPQNIASIPLG
jgi:membrane-associated protease RseP (regulator of RpoE activity)